MKQLLVSVALLALTLATGPGVRGEYPKPSPYLISWQFNFEHRTPKRVVVEVPGSSVPQGYWYMTYTVTNNTDQERIFLPDFRMMTKDGKVIRSDIGIPMKVFEAIKTREKIKFLEPYPQIAGEVRLGEDQQRDGVAIWPEPMAEMGQFSIFAAGLSGEIVLLKDDQGKAVNDADGKPVILRKTLQLNYLIRGDEVFPGEDAVNESPKEWIMR